MPAAAPAKTKVLAKPAARTVAAAQDSGVAVEVGPNWKWDASSKTYTKEWEAQFRKGGWLWTCVSVFKVDGKYREIWKHD